MKKCAAIAIDVGTSSCKLGIVSVEGEVLFDKRKFFPVMNGKSLNASSLFALVLELLNLAIDWSVERGILLLGICISGNGPTLVSIDKTNREKDVLLMWNEEYDITDDELSRYIKNSSSIFLPRLIAFKTQHNEAYQNAQYLLPLVEYLSFRLTGNAYTLLPEKRFAHYYWDDDMLASCSFNHSLLAPFVELGFCAGTYRGVKLFLGPPDYVAALIGTASLFAGTACDVAGSSEGINITVDSVPSSIPKGLRLMPSPSPHLWTLAALFSDVGTRFATAVKDMHKTYAFRSNNIEDNFLEVMEVICECYFKKVEEGEKKVAFNSTLNVDGKFDGMLGSFTSNDFLPPHFSKLYAQVMSILSSLKDAFNLLEETTGFKQSYVLSGGHAKNEAYTKMKAHFTGRSFSLLQHRDAELLGDAVIVFYRCGIYSSLQEAARKVVKLEKAILV